MVNRHCWAVCSRGFSQVPFFKLVVLLINMWLVFIETSQNFSRFLLFCLCAILNKYVQWCTNGCITYILDSIPTFTTKFIFRRTYTGIHFPNLGSSLPWLGVFMLNGRYGKHPYNNNDFLFYLIFLKKWAILTIVSIKAVIFNCRPSPSTKTCKHYNVTTPVLSFSDCGSLCYVPCLTSFPLHLFFSTRDKRVITLDTIYTQGRGLPLPFHQYQHLKFIKLWGSPPACNFRSP